MAYDFPANPTIGQNFTPPGGLTYSFDGVTWNLAGSSSGGAGGGAATYVGDTPPVAPTPGGLWLNSLTGALYIWYADGSSAQWVQVSASPQQPVVPEMWELVLNKTYTGALLTEIVKDLGAYRTLKFFIEGYMLGTDSAILLQPSDDNGATFYTTAAGFGLSQMYTVHGAAPMTNTSTYTGYPIANAPPSGPVGNIGFSGECVLSFFNKPNVKVGHSRSVYFTSGGQDVNNSGAIWSGHLNLFNAFKLVQNAGTGWNGIIKAWGMRG